MEDFGQGLDPGITLQAKLKWSLIDVETLGNMKDFDVLVLCSKENQPKLCEDRIYKNVCV